MYEDKIKKELFEKLRELNEVVEERDAIEENTGLSYMELRYKCKDADYGGLCHREMQLEDDIRVLLSDSKRTPLTLTDNQLKKLSFYAKTIDPEDPLLGEKIEKSVDCELLNFADNMKERLKRVKPLLLTASIDPRTNGLYKQVIDCYGNGAFEASCVLCRAIVEAIAKRYIEYKGYGDLLVGEEKQLKKLTVPGVLREKLSIPIEIIKIYSRIARKADRILHERDEKAEENDALEAIQLLQSFMVEFPKTL
ncbi:MAG: hypothetical protein A2471_02255 [Omnitrophica WOR_2 bacterium RIFOXYC2_FULL_45_15]|nr:MAG: hypothetical protein A2471_02255 [Omnitrophica WOR_2 bacterium RIFOXYC2_FULL_45_15]